MTEYEKLQEKQFGKIKAAIRRSGPVGFTQARQIAGSHDAKLMNSVIRGWIKEGRLTLSWDSDGNSLLGLA